jgi:hypothetical protein
VTKQTGWQGQKASCVSQGAVERFLFNCWCLPSRLSSGSNWPPAPPLSHLWEATGQGHEWHSKATNSLGIGIGQMAIQSRLCYLLAMWPPRELRLSKPHFPHLQNRDNNACPSDLRRRVMR